MRDFVRGAGQPRDCAKRSCTKSLTFNLNSAAARGITGIDSRRRAATRRLAGNGLLFW